MIGITSYGGYIPRPRLNRMSIFQSMGWLNPAIVMMAQGERSFCNWDEDSLTMAVAASKDCLNGIDKNAIDALYLCSTTLPFADRLNAGIVKTALNLRDDILAEDFTSSLKAGTSALITAMSTIQAGERRQVLVTATDMRVTKPANFYEMWFGDGAASLLVGDTDVIAEFKGSYSVSHDFVDHYRGSGHKHEYMWEERWVRDEGYAKIIPEAISGLFDKLSISMDDVDTLVYPCYFKREHAKIGKKLGTTPEKVVDNLHEVCGEAGTAHPFVMFVSALEKASPGDRILVAGFGQGCDALYFQVTDNIQNLAPRSGIKEHLENKKVVDNYQKFLQWRDLFHPDMGIRAEGPNTTALTVLWRKRKMLLGLVGGQCKECGTPQFPKMDICINPECNATYSQEDYEFADEPAFVKTFTGDYLAVSVDPPTIYGIVQFENGGRMLADFTDCDLEEVKVGQPVRMSFRKRYYDDKRGFHGYFWKAVPIRLTEEEKKRAAQIRFDDRVAIVTGAGAGLGRVYALELAKRGVKVVVNDLGGAVDGSGKASKSPADKVVKEIKALGGEAVASYDSVASAEGGEAIIDKAIEAFGRLDILINNAGIIRDKTLAKMEREDWEQVISVHLNGAYNVTRPAFLKMRENGYGRIVMTASAAGLYGNFGQVNYSAAKMGLIGFMNTLKLEGEKHNIKVNTIAPMAATRMTEGVMPPDLSQRLKPEFVAPLVLYLCSEQCPVTGGIYNAGMGYFSRAAVVTGPGLAISDGQKIPTPEEVFRHMDEIKSTEGAKEFYNTTVSIGPMLEAFSPKAEAVRGEEEGLTIEDVFHQLPDAFQADQAAGVDVVFQFKISGPGGDDWYVTVKDGACEVNRGEHSNPAVILKMSDEDFPGLMTGKLDGMQAFTTGRLKIEGDLMKSQLVEKLFKL